MILVYLRNVKIASTSKTKLKNEQIKSSIKRATKNQPSNSDEEHSKSKFDNSDSYLNTQSEDHCDNSDAISIL